MAEHRRQNVCPWCGEDVVLHDDGVMFCHRAYYMPIDRDCPGSLLTLEEARDKTDRAFIHHAATGD